MCSRCRANGRVAGEPRPQQPDRHQRSNPQQEGSRSGRRCLESSRIGRLCGRRSPLLSSGRLVTRPARRVHDALKADMAETVLDKKFADWCAGLAKAVDDPKWGFWDCETQVAVGEYNKHLAATPGFVALDWQLVKSMLWTETGANSPQWRTKPLQIGVPGDPGLSSLLGGKEGGELILLPEWQSRLTANAVKTIPEYNLRAGIGFLLMRLSNSEYRTVVADGATITKVTVKSGDSLDKIARAQGSTTDLLKRLNPAAAVLRVQLPL